MRGGLVARSLIWAGVWACCHSLPIRSLAQVRRLGANVAAAYQNLGCCSQHLSCSACTAAEVCAQPTPADVQGFALPAQLTTWVASVPHSLHPAWQDVLQEHAYTHADRPSIVLSAGAAIQSPVQAAWARRFVSATAVELSRAREASS